MLVLHILAMSEKRFGGNRRMAGSVTPETKAGGERTKDKRGYNLASL